MSSTNHKKIMKKIIVQTLLIAFVAIMPSRLFAADPTATASGEIYAEMLSSYSVTKGSSLNFGKLIPTSTAGTVVINNVGTSCTETNVVKAAGHTFSAASFTISSPTEMTWSVGSIASQELTHETNTNYKMNVVSFTFSATSGNTTTNKTFTVGATLNVGANQEIGKYTGSFPVTVTFN